MLYIPGVFHVLCYCHSSSDVYLWHCQEIPDHRRFLFADRWIAIVVAIALIVLALLIASQSVRKLFNSEAEEDSIDSEAQEHHA